jgi:beta-glucanase (GH16 family)
MKQTYLITEVLFSLLVIFSLQLKSQVICEGLNVSYTTTFNQCDNNPWALAFEDNFDGTCLDMSKWDIVTGIARDPYFESQKAWHRAENISVGNGILKIISKKETMLNQCDDIWFNETVGTLHICSDYDYTTGEILTKKKFSFGKIEALVKIPKGKGFFPAFWLFGGNPVYNEIDIFEFMTNNFTKHKMTTHFDLEGDGTVSHCVTEYNGPDFSLSYHIFSLIWDPNKIEWYVDGVLKRTDYKHYTQLGQSTGCAINRYTPYILNKIYPKYPMAIIFNTAIYNNSYKPDHTTPFPSQMEVDWVKYYIRSPCGDINITNSSQFILSNENFNFLIGNSVTINCGFSVYAGQQLKIIAKNDITLGAGFNVEVGSIFETKIDPTICN